MANKKKTTESAKHKKDKAPTKSAPQHVKLDSKTQLQVILFSLLTFGVFYIILNMKVKESKNQLKCITTEQQSLITTSEIPFEILEFIQLLGGLENIVNIDSTLNTIKIEVLDDLKVNADGIKKLGAKGILKTNNKFSIIFGDYALHLKNEMMNSIPATETRPTQTLISDQLATLPDFHNFINDANCEKPQTVQLKATKTI